jgi:hypothetical protein
MVALITEAGSPLGEALVRQLHQTGTQIAAVFAAGQPEDTVNRDDLLCLDMGTPTGVGAKNLVFSVQNRFDRIDLALILHTPSLERKLLHEHTFAEIERGVDQYLKGPLFLIKELKSLFDYQQAGSLILIQHDQDKPGISPPLENAMRGGFQALGESLFAGMGRDIDICGFASRLPAQVFADQILSAVNQGKKISRRWHRSKSRLNLKFWKLPF